MDEWTVRGLELSDVLGKYPEVLVPFKSLLYI